jgi:hypothetical protein
VVQVPLVECKFFIPLRRDGLLSDGREHEGRFWEWLKLVLFEKFGGITIAPGTSYGFYRDLTRANRLAMSHVSSSWPSTNRDFRNFVDCCLPRALCFARSQFI